MLYNLPNGIARAFLIGEKFISNSHISLILGDNLFHGNQLISMLEKADKKNKGALFLLIQLKMQKDMESLS